jgi:cell wall-associated NlpC family hydrolase
MPAESTDNANEAALVHKTAAHETATHETAAGETLWTRRQAIKALTAWGGAPLLTAAWQASGQQMAWGATESCYRLEYSGPVSELIDDLENSERGDPARESAVPHAAWYSAEVRRRYHTWGPPARSYAPLANLAQAPLEWKRERVIATAARFLRYGYQNHHVPDWNPPANWPWKETSVGHNGKGIDCSNLTSFVYNQGFGIRMTAAIRRQAEANHALKSHHESISVRAIELPKNYEQRIQTLCTGDLVYIRGRPDGPITHVVTWIGSIGRSPSGVPLVIDSHGTGVKDDSGQPIPCGVQLRPFRQDSWYNRCASHAHRIFGDQIS